MATVLAGVHFTAPASGLTGAQGTGSGGLSGLYTWVYTYVTYFGESLQSPASGAVSIAGAANLTGILVGPAGVISRNIYRTVASGTVYKLVGNLSNNTATTFIDTIADGSLTNTNPPVFSTSDSVETIQGFCSFAQPFGGPVSATLTAVAPPGTAPVITSYSNIVTTCPNNGAVQLFPASTSLLGVQLTIRNTGANPLLVLPASGQTVMSGASLALASNATVELVVSSATNWAQYV